MPNGFFCITVSFIFSILQLNYKKKIFAQVLEFLTSEDTLTLPDKIEEVNSHLLMKIIEEEKFVTALFFDESQTSNDVLTGFRTFQPLNFQPQVSSPDFSTQDFYDTKPLIMNFLNQNLWDEGI